MSLEVELKESGFTQEEIAKLSADKFVQINFSNKSGAAVPISEKIRKIANVYDVPAEDIRKAILSFPPFAGLDHESKFRKLAVLGSRFGFSKGEAAEIILDKPVLAGYSIRRYRAAIDVAKEVAKNTGLELPSDREMVNIWLNLSGKSPYVPNTVRLSISQAKALGINASKPPLQAAMEKRLANMARKAIAV